MSADIQQAEQDEENLDMFFKVGADSEDFFTVS